MVTAYLSQPKRANILKEVNTTTLDSVVIQRLAPLLQQCDPPPPPPPPFNKSGETAHTRCYRGGGAVEAWELAVRGER